MIVKKVNPLSDNRKKMNTLFMRKGETQKNLDKTIKSVAVIYHYFALYRYDVLNKLMKSKEIKYTLFSAQTSGNDIKTIK